MPGHGLVHLLDLPDEQLEIIEVEVGPGRARRGPPGRRARAARRVAGHLRAPRGGGGFVPKADTVINVGDEVLLVLDPGLEEAITAQFAPNGAF